MQFEVQPDAQQVAEVAASRLVASLKRAIAEHGSAVWVLAGGTAPMLAYRLLAEQYQPAVDWSKVTVLLGDERCVPTDDPDSNWVQISPVLLDGLPVRQLRPDYELLAEEAAEKYEAALQQLPKTAAGLPRLDVVWLGMGEDGHTLSLFPGHPGLQPTKTLVLPIHDSPKPPPDRISLTLRALQGCGDCLVMAPGAGKAPIIAEIKAGNTSLPVVQAAATVTAHGGKVTCLIDTAADGTVSELLQ